MRYILEIKMEDVCKILDQLYKKVLLGATLEGDTRGYIVYLNPDLSEQAGCTNPSLALSDVSGALDGVPGQRGPSSEAATPPEAQESRLSRARELKLLQLTVINVILSRALSAETETHAKLGYKELTKVLLQSAEVDSKLICMLRNPDKLLSHMAAKCLASLLHFQLKEKITLSNPWITFCQKHLSESSESGEVAHCLWILTAVMKEIFRDVHSQRTELLKQLLTPFDITFEVFYNSLFSQHFGNFQNPSNIVNILMCFLELLELLLATRIHLKLHFRSQRVLFLKPHALDILAWPIPAFVKRKLVIVIKKCLLCKVGEDLCCGSVPAPMSPDRLVDSDMLALADALLHTVDMGLWKAWPVPGKPSCFGGDEIQPGCRPRAGPDHVMLRAASLITMKSLEIKFQTCTSATDMKADLQKFMSALLAFLKPHLRPSLQSHNPCEWLSRVFIEQDDDMLEAAKASLSIYLQLTRERDAFGSLTQEREAWIRYTHENGCNPHCVFLFFLQNIAFDSTVLLDFLISSETCFLEYFVKYLKLLQKDWAHFLSVCKFFDGAEAMRCGVNICDPVRSLVHDRNTSHTVSHALAFPLGRRNACSWITWASDASSEPHSQTVVPKETHTVSAHSPPSREPQSLVDYDSSEDSEEEATGLHLANSEQASLCQEMTRQVQGLPVTCKHQKELSPDPQFRPLLPKESDPPFSDAGEVAPGGTGWEVGLFLRAVKCLEELQGAVVRLQEKDLFPYNPARTSEVVERGEGEV